MSVLAILKNIFHVLKILNKMLIVVVTGLYYSCLNVIPNGAQCIPFLLRLLKFAVDRMFSWVWL